MGYIDNVTLKHCNILKNPGAGDGAALLNQLQSRSNDRIAKSSGPGAEALSKFALLQHPGLDVVLNCFELFEKKIKLLSLEATQRKNLLALLSFLFCYVTGQVQNLF